MNTFRKVEFWFATGLFLVIILLMIFPSLFSDGTGQGGWLRYKFEDNYMYFDEFQHYVGPRILIATVAYLAFVAFNNWLIPRFFEKDGVQWGVLLGLLVLFFFWLMLDVALTWRLGYMLRYNSLSDFYRLCGIRAFIVVFTSALGFTAYTLLKIVYFQYLDPVLKTQKPWKRISPDIGVMLVLWALVLFAMVADGRPAKFLIVFWNGACLMIAYALYEKYVFLPYYRKEQPFKRLLPALLLIFMISSFLGCFLTDISTYIRGMGDLYFMIVLCNIGIALLSWWMTKLKMSRKDEVLVLEKALGRSSANLDFLRSQINPHFLFNALNTLYGTALQEHAGRTSEGIQRLGDMMRFMLHENVEEKIHLSKEVAYLQNYIALQRLRTQESPDIKIEVNITESGCEQTIAPMLLIPFVENAFKHGISLRNRSWIVVSLSCDAEHIYFDAYNSVHTRPDNDPEKNSLGIGLNNVRHRLQHLYPGRHELSIRQTNTEFFVHLTITTQKAAATA